MPFGPVAAPAGAGAGADPIPIWIESTTGSAAPGASPPLTTPRIQRVSVGPTLLLLISSSAGLASTTVPLVERPRVVSAVSPSGSQ